jgi:predicted outer membrane lipoprotein
VLETSNPSGRVFGGIVPKVFAKDREVVKMLSNLILRRIILLGTPLVVAVDVVLLHPVLDGDLRDVLFPVADWWLGLHVAQLVLFGLMGVAAYLLLDGLGGIAATVGRLAIAVFVVFYDAADAVAGIATGILAHGAVDLSARNQVTVGWAIEKIFTDPTKNLLFTIGSYAWSIGLLAAAVALYRAGSPRLPLVALVVAALPWIDFSGFDHSPPFDPIALAFFLLAALWLELAQRRKRLVSARAEGSPDLPSFSQSD